MLRYKNNFITHRLVKSRLVKGTDTPKQPVVSIAIPTHGRPHLITKAIDSALRQKFEMPYEVIVVDNCSDPDEFNQLNNIIEQFNSDRLFLYTNEKNIGMIGNWNRCIEMAHADWLIILHDDDVMHPLLLNQLWRNRTGTALVSSSTFTFSDDSHLHNISDDINIYPQENRYPRRIVAKNLKLVDVLKEVPITASGTLLHKESCMHLGGYHLDLWPHFDYLFSAKYIIKFGGTLISSKLLYYRLHQNSSSLPDVYIKFHRAKFVIRKSVVLAIIASGPIRISILKIISRLKWLDFYSELNRYISSINQPSLRFERYLDLFANSSMPKRILHRVERIVYPQCLSYLLRIHNLFARLDKKSLSRDFSNLADWISNEE